MPGQGRKYTPRELTAKQQLFIDCLTNTKSDTFADITKSMQTAGYKHGSNPKITAVNLLANQNILQSLLLGIHKTQQISIIRQETAKERIWRELEEALTECKTASDMTNRLRVIDMMGKYHDLWSNKLTVCVEQSTVLSVEDRKYLAELSRLHLASGTPQLIEACFSAVNSDIDVQDAVCDSIGTPAISDNDTDNTDTIDCNNSNDNELQSNESDNPSATQQTLSDQDNPNEVRQ